jgi:potassium-transporting ATPase KdpC subunit
VTSRDGTDLRGRLGSQVVVALRMLLALTVLCGLAYPIAVTGAAQVLFPHRADGSLVERDGRVIGSTLLGQPFEGAGWFHPRPSAAGDGYDGAASGASNLGPTNDELRATVQERAAAYRRVNGLAQAAKVAVDAVTASGSGLDPHISVANARLQAPRVARELGLPLAEVVRLVERHTEDHLLGEPAVNVLQLNLAVRELDATR